MPNWEITPNLRDALRNELDRLMGLRIAAVEQNFPLKPSQIQEAIMPEQVRSAMMFLKNQGVQSISQQQYVFARVAGDGFSRPSLLQFTAKNNYKFYYLYQSQSSSYNARDAFRRSNLPNSIDGPKLAARIPFDLETLDDDSFNTLADWTNAAISEHRICKATKDLVQNFLSLPRRDGTGFAPTLAHLSARWPDLKVLFTKIDTTRGRQSSPWVERMRDPPSRQYARWKWPWSGPEAEWYQSNKKKMHAAGQVIVGATLMDRSVEYRHGSVFATVVDWEGNAG